MRIKLVQDIINLFKKNKYTGIRPILIKYLKLEIFITQFFGKILPSKTVKDGIVFIDSLFPLSCGWRSVEIKYLLENNITVYIMSPTEIGDLSYYKHTYGISFIEFKKEKYKYSKLYPKFQDKIQYLDTNKRYNFKLAYSYFLGETYTLLPFYNKNKIPFVFVLYPGGGLGLNNDCSIKMLKEIFKSPYFKKVIVTQKVTRDFLALNKFCPEDKIEYIFGGYVQFDKTDIPHKKYFPVDKRTIDVCFVAKKYCKCGVDKGYDKFIEVAKILSKKYNYLRFHVVGNFDKNDINIETINDRITFYGIRDKEFLKNLYSYMDICVSPNTHSILSPGSFDGFPLGIDCMMFGTVLMTTDELNNNKEGFYTNNEIILIKSEVNDIVTKIERLLSNVEIMYQIGNNGKRKTNNLMNSEARAKRIITLLFNISEDKYTDKILIKRIKTLEKLYLKYTKATSRQKEQLSIFDKMLTKFELYRPYCDDSYGSFKFYCLENNMKEKIELLKRNLDENSCKLIDKFLFSIMTLPDASISPEFLLSKNITKKMETAEEKEIKKIFYENIPIYKKEFDLMGERYLEETFVFHNGLKFCSTKMLEYINNKDFIDGGAFIGDSALIFNKYYNPRKIYSFDISKKIESKFHEIMKRNCVPYNKYAFINLGLSDCKKEITFDDNAYTGTSLLSDGTDKIKCTDIDSFVEENNLNIGFIKIDLEGSAYEAILGAQNTIKVQKPILCISIYHSPKEFFEVKPLLEQITQNCKYIFKIKKLQHIPYVTNEYVIFSYPKELEESK